MKSIKRVLFASLILQTFTFFSCTGNLTEPKLSSAQISAATSVTTTGETSLTDFRATPGICDWRAPEDTLALFQKIRITRVFVPNVLAPGEYLVTKINNACQDAWNAGLIPVVSFKLAPADVTAGLWDTKLTNLGKWLAGKPEAWIVPWHEPENDLAASQFVAMFNRVYSKIKSVNANVKIGYVSMAYCWRPGDSRTSNPAAWKPAKADFFGCDVYSGNSFPITDILPEHPGFSRWQQAIPGNGPYMIIERGFIAKTDALKVERAKQIRREAAWLVSTELGKKCEAYLYWNTSGAEDNPALVLDAQGETALNELFGKISPW